MNAPSIERFGEGAYLVVLGGGIDPAVNRRAHRIAAALRTDRAAGGPWDVPVPAYESVLVSFDPEAIRPAQARRRLESLVAQAEAADAEPDHTADAQPDHAAEAEPGPPIEIPTRYGGPDGPDLPQVAERLGLSESAVIELHAGRSYQVYLLGFSPGFAYLGPLPPELRIARRYVPRERVPAGSVAIAGAQTAVYPTATPGGWQLIGRTDARLWDAAHQPPALLRPGGTVRFVPLRDHR
ncbi:MAG TPA: 5-oxoprolinase subunit PxpB [Candidatus Limnocylindrales bacterium]|nr:5-oxoprolinase subunit PxpB [Candidatus Limnocylindrales bacterium]